MGRCEEAIDNSLISIWPCIVEKCVKLFGGWRQANQVETDATKQCRTIRFGRRRNPVFFKARTDEQIDWVPGFWLFDAWQHWAAWRGESPMLHRRAVRCSKSGCHKRRLHQQHQRKKRNW